MHEKTFLSIIQVFGEKFYHLHVGFAALFNLCLDRRIFSDEQFQREREEVAALPELKALRAFLDGLRGPMAPEGIDAFLREYKGPVQ